MSNVAIKISHLAKMYRLYDKPIDRLKEALNPFKKKCHHDFHALNDVSFEIQKGETVGILGRNGAGKSTLLKIITGVLTPSAGHVHVNGRIASLLELGAGFNPEYTGMENIYLQGTLMGYTHKEMENKIDEILEFADIGEFVYQQVKTYSSGMFARLAFSIAVNINPDILIVDEALSVGDIQFQQKSIKKMIEFSKNGKTILFVSHDINSIKILCDSAILIDDGRLIDQGEPKKIINFYQNMMIEDSHQGKLKFKQRKSIESSSGKNMESSMNIATTGEVELLDLVCKNETNKNIKYIISESILKICFKIKPLKDLAEPHYGFILRNKYGISAFEINTYRMKYKTKPLKKDKLVQIEFEFICNLGEADYSITIGVANKSNPDGSFEEYLLFLQDVAMIKVIKNTDTIDYVGYTNLNPKIKIQREN